MRNPKRRGSGSNRNTSHRNDRFSLGSFVRDVVSGAVMGGLASVAFYGAGKGVEALKQGGHDSSRYLSISNAIYKKGIISDVSDLSQEQIDALRRYTGKDYKNMNNYLRGGIFVTPKNKKAINIIKATLDMAELPEDIK